MEMVWRTVPQVVFGHFTPSWLTVCRLAREADGAVDERPWKGKVVVQDRQRSQSGVQDWKRTESAICDSRGWISVSCCAPLDEVLTRYFEVSSPRHAASRVMFVPLIGAHKRSTGGRICLWR